MKKILHPSQLAPERCPECDDSDVSREKDLSLRGTKLHAIIYCYCPDCGHSWVVSWDTDITHVENYEESE
jgi:hypothetical protein